MNIVNIYHQGGTLMDMKSFSISVGDFFLMDTGKEHKFDESLKNYVIPRYQREYKWTKEKVKTLIADINTRDKFLGNLILNKVSECYEIVDGQQRITTIMLILIALFNSHKLINTTEKSEEQKDLMRYIFKNDSPILKNESVGQYLLCRDNVIELNILEQNDIYFQRETFNNIYAEILSELDTLNNLISFQKKLLDCQMVVIIGEDQRRQNDSIEEIFLDINFKSQLLDVSDIFKGYCFKNYSSAFHDELKEHWTKIRKNMKQFEKIGYNDTDKDKETCAYIYNYLLSCPDSYKIPANLSYNGKHYLADKTHTETKNLLLDMGEYGEHIMTFVSQLNDISYIFEDICSDAKEHRGEINNHINLKKMLLSMIMNTNIQYYKLPLLMFIHYLLKYPKLKNAFTYGDFKKIVSNYYAYSLFFINDGKNKNKSSIDHTIFAELYKIHLGETADKIISNILSATKNLRISYLNNYEQFTKFVSEKACALYSLIDKFDSANNYLTYLYSLPEYNKEHLIAHDNSKLNVTWDEENNKFIFSLKELLGNSGGNSSIANQYRKLSANYLILPEQLNGYMGQYDIVKKVLMLKEYYHQTMPRHVDIFISHIESLDSYTTLLEYKGQKKSRDEITAGYKNFVNEYFSDDNQRLLYERIKLALKEAFQNH